MKGKEKDKASKGTVAVRMFVISVINLLPTLTMMVGVGVRLGPSVYLSVCLFVYQQHNSKTNKTNDPKVFKLGVGNDLGIS